MRIRVWAALAALCMSAANATAEPFHVYLTYPGDPCTSIAVNFHTKRVRAHPRVYYDTQPREGKRREYAFEAEAVSHQIANLPDERVVNVGVLDGLEPGRTYYFIAGSPMGGFTEERAFRAIEAEPAPLRFVTGGDMGATPLTRALLEQAAKRSPAFCVVGGDIAYANGNLEEVGDWDLWFQNWEELMITPEGLTIPIVAAIGNHEVNKLNLPPPDNAPFFHGFLYQEPGKTYFARRFGAHTALVVLDTGHETPHAAQVDWLRMALEGFAGITNTMAVYHVPLYPSHRAYEGEYSKAGREYWGPVFDEYRLDVAFENHDHTFKRSKRLKGNAPDPAGTLYLGDGSFGVPPREVDKTLRPYLDKAESRGHVWIVESGANGLRFEAIDKDGVVFDRYELAP